MSIAATPASIASPASLPFVLFFAAIPVCAVHLDDGKQGTVNACCWWPSTKKVRPKKLAEVPAMLAFNMRCPSHPAPPTPPRTGTSHLLPTHSLVWVDPGLSCEIEKGPRVLWEPVSLCSCSKTSTISGRLQANIRCAANGSL